MREFLLFQLYGPLASWGDVAVGEMRPTMERPSKSAVLGLLAAALGLSRADAEAHRALASDLGYAVLLEQSGALLQDYHTVQIPGTRQARSAPTRADELAHDKLDALLSTRGYRTDALATVCLWLTDDEPRWSLGALRRVLEQPLYTPYLGRKSCPAALPFFPIVKKAETLQEAFAAYHADVPEGGRPTIYDGDGEAHLFVDVGSPPHGYAEARDQALRTVRDVPTERARWLFAEREELHLIVTDDA